MALFHLILYLNLRVRNRSKLIHTLHALLRNSKFSQLVEKFEVGNNPQKKE